MLAQPQIEQSWSLYAGIANITPTVGSADLPYVVLTDINDVVKTSYRIDDGRFGILYYGCYEGEAVVLKKFDQRFKEAWLHEAFIYNRVLPKHENILQCFFCASVMNGTESELWMVTEYHPLRSLQDYLRQNTLTPQTMLLMVTSLCSGLAYLHSESSYNQLKLPVAHCNLCSKNVLVKSNLTCCIAGFRLAVFKYKNEVWRTGNSCSGSRSNADERYMPPELLNGSIIETKFESFKHVDVYSVGLVLWEVCQRTLIARSEGEGGRGEGEGVTMEKREGKREDGKKTDRKGRVHARNINCSDFFMSMCLESKF